MAKNNDEEKSGLQKALDEAKEFVPTFDKINEQVLLLDEQAHTLVKTFGQGAEFINSIKIGLVEAYPEMRRLGYDQAAILQMQQDIAGVMNTNLIMSKDVQVGLGTAAKISGQNAEVLAEKFKNAGFNLIQVGDQTTNAVNVARSLGVNAEKVTGLVVSNLDKLNQFGFKGGVEGLSRMAATAASLRIDMGKTLDLADKLFDPEQAIDMAASLQRLGATQSSLLDPLKLMDLAQNDPEELQKQIIEMTKSFATFNQETGKFEIPKGAVRQLKEIGSQLGYDYKEISKLALGAVEVDEKLSNINPNLQVDDDTKQFISNMAQMNKEGRYTVKITEGMETKDVALEDLTETQLGILKEMQKPKTGEDLAKEQQNVVETISNSVEAIKGKISQGIAASVPATDVLDIARHLGDGFYTGVKDVLRAENVAAGSGKMITEGIGSVVSLFKGDMDGVSNKMNNITDMIKTGFVDNVNAGAKGFMKAGTDMEKFMSNLGKKYGVINEQPTATTKGTNVNPPQKDVFISKDNVIQPIDENDNIMAFKKLTGMNKENSVPKGTHSTLEVTHKVAFDNLPPHINESNLVAHLEKVMNNLSFQESLTKSQKEIMSNYNLT